MSYPAYEQFGRQIGRGYAIWRVYVALQPPTLAFHAPKDIKAVWLAGELKMGRRHVIKALNWLVLNGYLIQHGKDAHGVRSLSLAYAIEHKGAA